MFPTAHPDIMGQLATERAAGLRAAAERYRRGRPLLAIWRKARFVEPAADLSRSPRPPSPSRRGGKVPAGPPERPGRSPTPHPRRLRRMAGCDSCCCCDTR
jgi:hypothetical protein